MRTLHPDLAVWLKAINALVDRLVAEGFKATPTNVRESLAGLTRRYVKKVPPVDWVGDDYVVTPNYHVPVRIYHPKPQEKLPVLVYFHGGGHMSGCITVYDPICRKLALATDHVVVTPEYRLAPECPYPAGVLDACGVVKHLWKTLDERNLRYSPILSIGGDSGGGALAATVSGKMQFDSSVTIKKQFLIYPSLDYTMNTPSIEENAAGYLLQKDKIEWYFDAYFQHDEDRKTASPLFGEYTQKLPESLVITAAFCPLRDEGIRYVEQLRIAGVQAEHLHFDDMIHAFLNLEDLVPEACAKLYESVGTFLRTP